MIFHDVDQNTDEWLALRCGKLTSSSLSKVMANYGKPFGEPAKQYAINIAIEQITGAPVSSGYSNTHMDRGHEEEPLARMAYEDSLFCDVSNGGFFELDWIGCSPDGLIDDDGVIEIKSAIPSVHFKRISSESYDRSYKWQLAGNLKFTERSYIDFVSYCSSFPDDKKMYSFRCEKKDFNDEFQMIDERIESFKSLITECKEKILNSKYLIA